MEQNTPTVKIIIWVIVAIVVIGAAYMLIIGQKKTEAPAGPDSSLEVQPGSDTTAAIQKDLNSVNSADLDAELKGIDDQLKNL